MTIPPSKRVDQNSLRELFKSGSWLEKLESCPKFLCGSGKSLSGVVVYNFKDATGKYIAVVSFVQQPDGSLTNPVPIRLLIDGIWHHAVVDSHI
jgi:hypothetical protein